MARPRALLVAKSSASMVDSDDEWSRSTVCDAILKLMMSRDFIHAHCHQQRWLGFFTKVQLPGKKSELVRLSVLMWGSIVGSIALGVGFARPDVVDNSGLLGSVGLFE
jgi:hypothetical protein